MQECGFFNAHLIGDEYDRVYLAEQFAAYFAAFIGNGIYGKSMQKLQVLCQNTPNMSVKVLSGEAYINGWWYRNNDTCNVSVQMADGVLSRIDAVVLRWGRAERNMWLHIITGIPSGKPVKPALRRDADYYDLQLATIEIPASSIRITQAQIKDTRLDNSVCGLVTGVIDQIDTTGLYNQFEAYFNEFKDKQLAGFDEWAAGQKKAYYDWTIQMMFEYTEFIKGSKEDYNEYVTNKKEEFNSFTSKMEKEYQKWSQSQKQKFHEWLETHIIMWTTEFTEWFENLKYVLDGDVAGNLQLEIDAQDERMSRLEHMVFTGILEAPLATANEELIATCENEIIMADWPICICSAKAPEMNLSDSDGNVLVTNVGIAIGVDI